MCFQFIAIIIFSTNDYPNEYVLYTTLASTLDRNGDPLKIQRIT